ncbi:MAG: hypothetical protein ABSG53_19920 [Thermoguttaceae bacterium]
MPSGVMPDSIDDNSGGALDDLERYFIFFRERGFCLRGQPDLRRSDINY